MRWAAAPDGQAGARPFSFSARLDRTVNNFTGLCVDAMQTVAGHCDLQIDHYIGVAGNSARPGTVTVGWNWNVWAWVELEIEGPGRAHGSTPRRCPRTGS